MGQRQHGPHRGLTAGIRHALGFVGLDGGVLRSGNFRRRQFTSADSELDITAEYRGCPQTVILKPGSFLLPVISDCAAGSE